MKGTAPGILLLYVLDAVLLTVPVSLIVIWLYRRTVERAMHAASGTGESATPLHVASRSREYRNPAELEDRERSCRLRLALVYSVAGCVAALVWTWLYSQTSGIEFTGLRAFSVSYVFCWPVPATLITLLAIPWRLSMWVVAVYLATGMLALSVWSTLPHLISGQPGIHWMGNLLSFLALLALEAGLPALIIAIASGRRIRGVSPLALAALLVFTFSSVAAREGFVTLVNVGGLRKPLLAIGLNWWFMIATLPVGYLCWRLLALLNAGYRNKSFSDIQLVVDSFWLIVAFVFSAQYASDVGWKGIEGLVAFVVYRGLAQLGLVMWHLPRDPGTRLLVLQSSVFAAAPRSCSTQSRNAGDFAAESQ